MYSQEVLNNPVNKKRENTYRFLLHQKNHKALNVKRKLGESTEGVMVPYPSFSAFSRRGTLNNLVYRYLRVQDNYETFVQYLSDHTDGDLDPTLPEACERAPFSHEVCDELYFGAGLTWCQVDLLFSPFGRKLDIEVDDSSVSAAIGGWRTMARYMVAPLTEVIERVGDEDPAMKSIITWTLEELKS